MEYDSDPEDEPLEYNPKDGCIQKTVIFLFYQKQSEIHCDLYFKGVVTDKKYFEHLACEFYEDAVFEKVKKSHVVMGQARIHPRHFTDDISIKRLRGLLTIKKVNSWFKQVSSYDINSKTKSMIKEILNKPNPHFTTDLYAYHHISDDEEAKILIPSDHRVDDLAKKTDDSEQKSVPGSSNKFLNNSTSKSVSDSSNNDHTRSVSVVVVPSGVIDQKSGTITPEMEHNINDLISINHLKKDNFIIDGDKAMLKDPVFPHIIGEWLTDRHLVKHFYEVAFIKNGELVKMWMPVCRYSRINKTVYENMKTSLEIIKVIDA